LHIGEAPRTRRDREVEPGRAQCLRKDRLVVENLRVHGEITIGREWRYRHVARAHAKIDRLRAHEHDCLTVNTKGVECIDKHTSGGDILRVVFDIATHQQFP
jgi:hypothetical protein